MAERKTLFLRKYYPNLDTLRQSFIFQEDNSILEIMEQKLMDCEFLFLFDLWLDEDEVKGKCLFFNVARW